MLLKELNPYVRFARRREFRFAPVESVAPDHRIFIVEKGFSDTGLFDNVFCLRNTYGILPKFHELYEEYESRQIFWEQRCGALLKDILVLCLRFSESNQSSGSAWVAREVLNFIRQNYQKPLNNAVFSQMFHYHPSHISELVKSQTGLSLHKYIRTYRIYAAVDLLQSTDLPVAEIADRVGFGDVQQFSKAFKQVLGVPPSSYRK